MRLFRKRRKTAGFTLAELLISLAILGVIATFTIPKILTIQQNTQQSALAKEAASSVAAAYKTLSSSGGVSASTKMDDLTPYLNYVSIDSTTPMDDIVGSNNIRTCGTQVTCYKLHGGGTIYWGSQTFGGTSALHANQFFYDPDSARTGVSSDGPGKPILFVIYYNGRVTSLANINAGTFLFSGAGPYNPGNSDPSWFSW